MKFRLFKDQALQAQFEKDGYLMIPFLELEQVKSLNNFYHKSYAKDPDSFHASSFIVDNKKRHDISEFISGVCREKTAEICLNFKELGAGYLFKPVGESGIMPIHQDWTVVDESLYSSVTIWIALTDTNEKNGALQVIPGSHRYFDHLRAPGFPEPLKAWDSVLRSRLKCLPMKAGEAIIFDHALLHASSENISAQGRLACTYGITAKEARMLFYYQEPDSGNIFRYQMPDNLFLQYLKLMPKPSIGSDPQRVDQAKIKPDQEDIFRFLNANTQEKMRSLLKDPEHQKSFAEQGFALVKGVLNSDVIDELQKFYQSNFEDHNPEYGFHVSMDLSDKEKVRTINKKIFSSVLPEISSRFDNAKAYIASYVVKEPGINSLVPAHQDWSFVENESIFCSATVWIPLVDVTMNNGALGVIKGSYAFFNNLRPSPSPQSPSPLGEHMFTIFPYLHIVEMKAGDMLVFNNRTFHASPPNMSEELRLGIGIGMTQAEAELRHYYLKPDGNKNRLLKYKIDEEFFYKYENKTLSSMYDKGMVIEDYELMEEMNFAPVSISAEKLQQLILAAGNVMNKELVNRLTVLYASQIQAMQSPAENVQVNSDSEVFSQPKPGFFQIYTPANIIKEIIYRLKSLRS